MTAEKIANVDLLAKQLGIRFNDINLLILALTHSSYSNERRKSYLDNNQRLEFLGDAVLELVVSEYLYKLFPNYHEGGLTKLRASLVCEASLAKVAKKVNLGIYLSMGKGELVTGGRNRPSILADGFESIIGALYLDQGLATCKEFIINHLDPILKDIISGDYDRDFKTELQELIQHQMSQKITYVILKEEGPDHNKRFTAGVVLNGQIKSEGRGRSKKEAEQQAAKCFMQKIKAQTDKV